VISLEDEDLEGQEDEELLIEDEGLEAQEDEIDVVPLEDEDLEGQEDEEIIIEDESLEAQEDEEIIIEDEDLEGQEDEEEEMPVAYLANLKELSPFTQEEIQMAFFNGEDPSWTVLIKGHPVASISLSAQPKPDEVAELFASDEYGQNVASAMVQCGAEEVLTQVKAKLFANKIQESALAAQMTEKAKTELQAQHKAALASLQAEFKSCIAVVLAGMNKNFWQDADNPLKASLYNRLTDLGVSDPSSVIEAAFAEAADGYFDVVLSKAVDFMGKNPEAREEIAKAITEANVIVAHTPEAIKPGVALAHKLEQNNLLVQITGNAKKDSKESLRQTLRLGKY